MQTDTPQDKKSWLEHLFIFGVILFVAGVLGGWCVYLMIEGITFQSRVNQFNKKIDKLSDTLAKTYQLLSEKAQDNGYAPLGNDSIVPDQFLPPGQGNLQQNSDCWDALINNPPLSDGIGAPRELFTVCTPGSTVLEGVSTWNLYDQVIFNPDLNQWIRIDAGRNTITDAQGVPVGSEESIIDDGNGPMFSLFKTDVSGDGTLDLTDNNTVLSFDIVGTPPPTTTLTDTPGGTGETLIAQGIGDDLEMKSFVPLSNVGITEESNTLEFNSTGNPLFRSGFTTIDVSLAGFLQFTGTIRFGWHQIGSIFKLSSLSPIDLTFFTINESGIIIIDLSTASDPIIAASAAVTPQGYGCVTVGWPTVDPMTTNANAVAGQCVGDGIASNVIRVTVVKTKLFPITPRFWISFEIAYSVV